MTHEEYESKSQMKRVEILKAEERMIHEELLAKLSPARYIIKEEVVAQLNAIRAVVELHKPHDKYKGVCSGCYEEESGFSDYPCPTIQTIQEQLK